MIPKEIRREHILAAIRELKSKSDYAGRKSRKYYLVHDGEHFPPKLVLSVAAQKATGIYLDPDKFSGGDESNQYLKSLGFEVICGNRSIQPAPETICGRKKLKCRRGNAAEQDKLGLRLGLVSFHTYDDDRKEKDKLEVVATIINSCANYDLIIFPGWSILTPAELKKLCKKVANDYSLSVIEIRHTDKSKIKSNKAIFLYGQKAIDTDMRQYFSRAREIEADNAVVKDYLAHLNKNRKFITKNLVGRVIICGEQNIVMNHQSEDNRVAFRMPHVKELREQFDKIFAETQIFVNPAHTPMGNQGKLKKRREFFSQDNRIYCFTTNNATDDTDPVRLKTQLLKKSLQYCYFNGKPYSGEVIEHTERFILRKFEF